MKTVSHCNFHGPLIKNHCTNKNIKKYFFIFKVLILEKYKLKVKYPKNILQFVIFVLKEYFYDNITEKYYSQTYFLF